VESMIAVAKPIKISPRTPLQKAARNYRQNSVSPYYVMRHPMKASATAGSVTLLLSISTEKKIAFGVLCVASLIEFAHTIRESFKQNPITSGIFVRTLGIMSTIMGSVLFLNSNLNTAGKGVIVGTFGLITLGIEKVSRMLKKFRAVENIDFYLDENNLNQLVEALKKEGVSPKHQIRLLKKLVLNAKKYEDGPEFYAKVAESLMPEIKSYLKEMSSAKRKIVLALLNRKLKQIGMKGVKA
jgi:hypothetical protein